MNLQTLFQDFNPGKFVVHSCLMVFTALLAMRLDGTITWSYWAVFTPIWVWKLLVILGATVGTYIWWRYPHFRVEGEAYVHYKAMLISLALHLILLMFELLACDKLHTDRHLWILVFIPLIFISIVSIAVCIWSVKHDRSYELELFCAVNMLQFIFLALKLDEFIAWTWEVVFVPLWILLCLSLVGVLYSIIFAGILLRTPEVNIQQRRTSFNSAFAYTFTVIPILVCQVLLANKLDEGMEISYLMVVSPLFVSYATLILMSFNSKGGNKWWFGIRKDFCQFLLAVCPLLQEYANIAYNADGTAAPPAGRDPPPPPYSDRRRKRTHKQPAHANKKDTLKPVVPIESAGEAELFSNCAEVEAACCVVTGLLSEAAVEWGPPAAPNNICARSYITSIAHLQALDRTVDYLNKIVKAFYRLNPRLSRLRSSLDLVLTKRDDITDILCSRRFILLEVLHNLIITILKCCLHREDTRKLIETSFSLISSYNQLLGLSYKSFTSEFNICSNVCPSAVSLTNKISITKVVQILAKSRAEISCHRLIDSLVHSYRPAHAQSDDSSSTGSLEIYHALTKHITPPPSTVPSAISSEDKRAAFVDQRKNKMRQFKSLLEDKKEQHKRLSCAVSGNSDSDVPYTSLVNENKDNACAHEDGEVLNGMLQSEEIHVQVLLDTAANMAPGMLGAGGVTKLLSGEVRIQKKAAHKVMKYYQSVLWGEVGGFLEHIVLWWSSCPLATRSPSTSQNLREWLMTFNSNNTPDLVLGALRILADALGCHVTLTSWDKLFSATLVTDLNVTTTKLGPDVGVNITECTQSGANFVLVLQELVTLSNQCEVTGDYILGAPLDELPLVEQIPLLHRLDHSIHTCRLWTLAETRKLANAWDMDDFFRIAHNDIQACLQQLYNLRFADHSAVLEGGKVGVHENVCGQMRQKLVSEIKVNIRKLKEASEEMTGVLASVCATVSLAHLTIVFPSRSRWRHASRPPDPRHSLYVFQFLDRVFLPVVKATKDVVILNMVLRIMCESWLHHIYVAKVKFSKDAAVQLLADFSGVRNWFNECNIINDNIRKQVLNNEVLRRCEGVGRLLLHTPGDLISMQDSTLQSHKDNKARKDEGADLCEQMMPAEMYVPNQQQWLTLRATKLHIPCLPLCCTILQ